MRFAPKRLPGLSDHEMNGSSTIYMIFQALLLSLLAVLAFAWPGMALARRFHLMDVPGSAPHKQHIRPTPLAGGITLAITFLLVGAWLGILKEPSIRAAVLAVIPVFVFSLWDDHQSLMPPVKLAAQIFSTGILISEGIYVKIFESPQFLLYTSPTLALLLDLSITILWVVGITNAFNFVDSMDGLLVGLAGMASAFFMLLTLDAGQPLLAQHSAMLVGICVGLYLYNSPPALLFLGDSGAQTLGFILAVLAIGYRPEVAYQASSWFVPILLLGVPIFDAVLVVVSRLRRRLPVYSANLDHTYHRLVVLVSSPNRAVLVMHIAAFILGCLAFLSLNQPPLQANLIFAAACLLGVAGLVFLECVALKG
jgi:UDP-GlcNAc:undecaprenyl-phosphate/decaprenyl-phosphate GlcNAc-1-phosphate transferase